MCKCGCTTTFKKCYVNVGAQPLSIKATKFPKWMWVYNNFKKLQNCKINVGVQVVKKVVIEKHNHHNHAHFNL